MFLKIPWSNVVKSTFSQKKSLILKAFLAHGVHGGTRTPDRTLRRRMLYPAELRGHLLLIYIITNIKKRQFFFNNFYGSCEDSWYQGLKKIEAML